jgi:hypothetical protein
MAVAAITVPSGATSAITASQAVQAKRELAKMKRSLAAWLKYRAMNDQITAGAGAQLPTPLLRHPTRAPSSPAVTAAKLARSRPATEAQLAGQLYQLLSEVFDPASLPCPDLCTNPQAAVQLAQIAIAGQLPASSGAPVAAGAWWVWPAVIVVGAIAIVIITEIQSSADVAKNQEQIACIEAGKCTDSGFWLKAAAIAVIGWIAWDKLGGRHHATKLLRKGAH